mgnify:CR=1 FL=1
MSNLLKSSFYRLSKDLALRICLIVAIGFAFINNFLNLVLSKVVGSDVLNVSSQSMFIQSFVPTSNLGIAIPILLIFFIVNEFRNGIIRNKIIAGHKKSTIYASLFIISIIYTFILLFVYALANALFGLIISGSSKDASFIGILKYTLMAICVFIFIVSVVMFFTTLFRNAGGAIPIVILIVFMLTLVSSIASSVALFTEETIDTITYSWTVWINPLYSIGSSTVSNAALYKNVPQIPTLWYVASIVTPLYWSAIFFVSGLLIFKKRDIK